MTALLSIIIVLAVLVLGASLIDSAFANLPAENAVRGFFNLARR